MSISSKKDENSEHKPLSITVIGNCVCVYHLLRLIAKRVLHILLNLPVCAAIGIQSLESASSQTNSLCKSGRTPIKCVLISPCTSRKSWNQLHLSFKKSAPFLFSFLLSSSAPAYDYSLYQRLWRGMSNVWQSSKIQRQFLLTLLSVQLFALIESTTMLLWYPLNTILLT